MEFEEACLKRTPDGVDSLGEGIVYLSIEDVLITRRTVKL